MCWFEEYDEPSTSIRVIQRRRIYREPTYSYSYSPPSYRILTRSPSLSPRYSRSSYTTITRTRRHTRSYDVIPERYETEPTYIEYRRRGGDVFKEAETNTDTTMNRSLSIRSAKKDGKQDKSSNRHRFSMTTLRGYQQPELSKKLYKIIKNENSVIGAYESAGRERVAIASQLSDWGEATGDEGVSDISDKLGVLLSEIGEQEDIFAQSLEEYRGVLKQIRNTESSVQPSRDSRNKISDEIQKLKYKDPSNTKLVTLEQELVRAEAQNLVAEAQLSNVTRQKVKEAFDVHTAAIIERAEKQIILAQHARRLVNLLDDTPIVPGDAVKPFEQSTAARDILNDAEGDLRAWEPSMYPITSNASEMGQNLVPKPEALAAGQQQVASPVADGVEAAETEARPAVEPEAVGNRESVATDVNESATIATA